MDTNGLKLTHSTHDLDSRQPLREVLSMIHGFALIVDRDGKIEEAFAPAPFGLPDHADAENRLLEEFVPTTLRDDLLLCIRNVLSGSGMRSLDAEILSGDDKRPFNLMFRRHEGGVLVVGRDVSASKVMTRLVFDAVEEERHRISGELHDTLCSHLYGISLIVSALTQEVSENVSINPSDLQEITVQLGKSVEMARDIAHGLGHDGPEIADIEGSIQGIARMLGRGSRVTCTYEREGDLPYVSGRTGRHVEQVILESVRNAVKHGRATNILVRITNDGIILRIEVVDNGVGFDEKKVIHGGLGISQMRNRANLIGAVIFIESTIGVGTSVRIDLPLEKYVE